MLPYYPFNQHPAIDGYERQRYDTLREGSNRPVPNLMPAAARAAHQAIDAMAAAIRHLVPRNAAPSPGSHICVPGVDC